MKIYVSNFKVVDEIFKFPDLLIAIKQIFIRIPKISNTIVSSDVIGSI